MFRVVSPENSGASGTLPPLVSHPVLKTGFEFVQRDCASPARIRDGERRKCAKSTFAGFTMRKSKARARQEPSKGLSGDAGGEAVAAINRQLDNTRIAYRFQNKMHMMGLRKI